MQTINIDTTQNVSISYQLANVGERIIANLIDYIFLGIYMLLISYLFSLSGFSGDSIGLWMLFTLPPFFYQLFFELVMHGQSPGMRIRKIKVIRLDGKQPSIGNYLLRWLLRPVDILLTTGLVSIISIAVSKNGQRLGDMAAGTTVVKLQEDNLLSNTIFEEVNEDYKVKYPQVEKLSTKDVEIIKESLSIYEKSNNIQPVIATAKKIRTYLNIEGNKSSVPFLKRVVKDYNYIHGKA
ncbi:RDD family protein [Cytophagaceae bacterium ABcell3]|nr:RDD family protein [Cytophagaceae bacterium ABcell3]